MFFSYATIRHRLTVTLNCYERVGLTVSILIDTLTTALNEKTSNQTKLIYMKQAVRKLMENEQHYRQTNLSSWSNIVASRHN